MYICPSEAVCYLIQSYGVSMKVLSFIHVFLYHRGNQSHKQSNQKDHPPTVCLLGQKPRQRYSLAGMTTRDLTSDKQKSSSSEYPPPCNKSDQARLLCLGLINRAKQSPGDSWEGRRENTWQICGLGHNYSVGVVLSSPGADPWWAFSGWDLGRKKGGAEVVLLPKHPRLLGHMAPIGLPPKQQGTV